MPPWDKQKMGCSMAEYMKEFREGIRTSLLKTGSFNVTDMDHNSKRYAGFSNKRARIAAVALDPTCEGKEFFPDQFAVLYKAAFGD